MTNEQLIALVREIADSDKCDPVFFHDGLITLTFDEMQRFTERVAAAEREACLEIADQCADADMYASMAANAIRARSNQ